MSPKKTLVLGSLLLLPVLAFLFLLRFGVNNFSLRTYFPVKVDSTLVEGHWQYDTVFHKVPDFRFISQKGKTITQKELEGDLFIANLFFSSCSNECHLVNTQLSRVQDAFRFNPRIKFLSISVDPNRDTPQLLDRYASNYRAKPKQWFFLTGPKSDIYSFANQGLHLSLKEDVGQTSAPAIMHSYQLVLVDKEKHIRGYYEGTDPKEVDRLITEVNVLLAEYEHKDDR